MTDKYIRDVSVLTPLLPRWFLREQEACHSSVSNVSDCHNSCVFTPGSAEQFSSSRFISAFWRPSLITRDGKKKVKAFGAFSTGYTGSGDVPDLRLHLTNAWYHTNVLKILYSLYQKIKRINLSKFPVILLFNYIQVFFFYSLFHDYVFNVLCALVLCL